MVDMSNQVLRNQRPKRDEGGSSWETLGWLVTSVLLVSLALVYGWNQQQMIGIGYQTEQLREENRRLLERQRVMRAEYQERTSAERLDRNAARMGLVSPNRSEVTIIEGGTPPARTADQLASAETRPHLDRQ